MAYKQMHASATKLNPRKDGTHRHLTSTVFGAFQCLSIPCSLELLHRNYCRYQGHTRHLFKQISRIIN